ncbi:MAG: hypothetical protein QOJ39_1551 [Candidatus Eremiobacteraeota bacterium]|jgi:hypothetical protein|nr:hypothetical protein [Candidatus Eremiobacteraeota bacterium]
MPHATAWWATPHALLWWVILIAFVVVLAFAGAQAARALRELNRFNTRLEELADLPLAKALPRAARDVQRIEAAIEQLAPLLERAKAAVAVIKRGPLPPELTGAIRRVRAEVAAFRAVTGR